MIKPTHKTLDQARMCLVAVSDSDLETSCCSLSRPLSARSKKRDTMCNGPGNAPQLRNTVPAPLPSPRLRRVRLLTQTQTCAIVHSDSGSDLCDSSLRLRLRPVQLLTQTQIWTWPLQLRWQRLHHCRHLNSGNVRPCCGLESP
jgi:hypothetical protein